MSVDIQGYLVEKLSGKTFPEFLRTRLFEPLGMIDTAFFVPADKLSRVATIYSYDKAKAGAGRRSRAIRRSHDCPGLPSGGGGLYGTAADYFRFAQMLLNGGEFGGKRILKKSYGRHDAHQRVERRRRSTRSPASARRGSRRRRASATTSRSCSIPMRRSARSARAATGGGALPARGSGSIRPTTWSFVGIIQRRGGVPGAANHEDISRRVIAEALPQVVEGELQFARYENNRAKFSPKILF